MGSSLFGTVDDVPVVRKSADFSPCRTYRYCLRRVWDEGLPTFTFIGLNPSTADETNDDPTIRRVIGFAKSSSCGGIAMVNLFAYRATQPKDMLKAADPIGPANNDAILKWCGQTVREVGMRRHPSGGLIVAGWGAHGSHLNRGAEVLTLLGSFDIAALALTKDGEPGHPLYLKKDATLIPYVHSTKAWG